MLQHEINNPFQYLTPDSIEAKEALNLFVDVFKDYYQILNIGNTFIHGPRGSGKSMMFRIMQPDCQKLKYNKKLHDIKFYAFYIPIKDATFRISELAALEKMHGGTILNEHFLCVAFASKMFMELSKEDFSEYTKYTNLVSGYYEFVISLLNSLGVEVRQTSRKEWNIGQYFNSLKEITDKLYMDFSITYLTNIIFGNSALGYNGPLCLYINFFLPIIKKLKELPFFPNAPFFFLIDDADELNSSQARILNTWVSFRSNSDLCFKISTQMHYPTYATTRESKIDTPHDYFEITLNQIYTAKGTERYRENVKAIVEKRLKTILGNETSAEDYFPSNKKQEDFIEKIEKELRHKKAQELLQEQPKLDPKDIDRKAVDFAYRNARPDYMKNLPNKYSYSYSGFNQLVHLSSGIIRNFLDLASKMYSETYKKYGSTEFNYIPQKIQDDEISLFSDNMIFSEFDKIINSDIDSVQLTAHKRLRNLIESLGKSFRVILLSNSSERRKFSFYFDGDLDKSTFDVIKLGVRYGYFHEATLGSKSGLGRSRLFVLNRMLAPYYKLDPFSFSGYLYLTPEMLNIGMTNPKSFVLKIEQKKYDYEKNENLTYQMELDLQDGK